MDEQTKDAKEITQPAINVHGSKAVVTGEQAQEIALQAVINAYGVQAIQHLHSNLDALLFKKLADTSSIRRIVKIAEDIENLANDVKQDVLYGPYKALGAKRYIDTTEIQIDPKNKYQVDYQGPYANFGAAIKDFSEQAHINYSALSGLAHVSVLRAQYVVTDRIDILFSRDVTDRERKNRLQSMEKILAVFDIRPAERISDIEKLLEPYKPC
jgi:hypothetical protein